MPKELRCRTCGLFLGKVEAGSAIRFGTTFQCRKCTELSDEIENIAKELSKGDKNAETPVGDMPEFLKDLLWKKPKG